MHYRQVKSILSPKNGMNLYRGCSHGCIYCDSRSTIYQMNHEFEDIEVKIPKGYDNILKSLYGDYMQLPPIEERVWKHHPVLIDFEHNYEDIVTEHE